MAYLGNRPAEAYSAFQKQDFTTSATTSYTLDHPVTNQNEIALFINFVRQEPTAAYTASGTSLTLTSATSSSDDMYCIYLGKAVQTVNPPSGSVGSSQVASSIITGQTAETSIATDDTVLIHDTSAGALRKMTRANFVSGIGGTNTPAFEAYRTSNQTGIANNSSVKVQFDVEGFDTNSAYDNSTNYRFTVPSGQAGKYFFYAGVQVEAGNGNSDLFEASCQIYKNGSVFRYNQNKFNSNPIKYNQIMNQATMDLSVGDYIEIYAHAESQAGSNSNIFSGSNKQTYFGGYKIIE